MTPIALTIAGSDSGAGAGIQADLRTFAALGVYGASAITALTAQNTRGVRAIHLAPPDIVAAQVEAVLSDFDVAAIKVGMLGDPAIVEAVAERLSLSRSRASFVVYDPVMTASSGDSLSGSGFVAAIRARLLPIVDCLTPNLAEAAALLGTPLASNEGEMASQGLSLLALGPRAVLMKGGHLAGANAVDLLIAGDRVTRFASKRLASPNLHGTGCTLSSALAAYVVLGMDLLAATDAAKAFTRRAIEAGRRFRLGGGDGPLMQFDARGAPSKAAPPAAKLR